MENSVIYLSDEYYFVREFRGSYYHISYPYKYLNKKSICGISRLVNKPRGKRRLKSRICPECMVEYVKLKLKDQK